MRDLAKTTAAIGSTEILLMGIALAKNKYLAMTIGPEGFGIYGFLNSFFMMVAVFASTWIAAGTTKYISEYHAKGDRDSANKVFTFAVIVPLLIGSLLTVLLVLERRWVMATFLPGDVRGQYYLLFTAAFVALSLRPVFLAVLQGMRRIREVVISRWSIASVDLVLVVVLTILFGLTGFFISLLCSALWATVVLLWAISRKGGLRFTILSRHDPIVKLLLSFGVMGLFLAFVTLSGQYIQRVIIISNMDITSVGLFQAGVAMMSYLGVVSRGTLFYYFPKMSEEMENSVRIKHINDYLYFILLVTAPIFVLAILFSPLAIRLLYSSEFAVLASVFFWFILGQWFTSIGHAFQLTLVGMARLKAHAFSTAVIAIFWVTIPILLIDKYGLASLGMGFVAGNAVGSVILGALFLRKQIDMRFSSKVIRMLIVVSIFLAGAVLIRDSLIIWRLAWEFITLLGIFVMIPGEERLKGYRIIISWIWGK